ncbi:unnamed protein product [Sphagnum jensenii]|uniref:Isoleucine--tRNA ligase n=1 Tax=Sphagnum jensenii TaxID=128206 RepID=A0ABP0VFS1_9BRYO
MEQMAVLLAPILPHLSEDLWLNIPYPKTAPSIFLKGWVEDQHKFPPHELLFWENIRVLKTDINKCIELARQAKLVGANQECKVFLAVEDNDFKEVLLTMVGDKEGILAAPKSTNMMDDLRFIFLTSQIDLVENGDQVTSLCPDYCLSSEINGKKVNIGVNKADGHKCERCWFYSVNVGTHHEHTDLCLRCADVLVKDGHSMGVKSTVV